VAEPEEEQAPLSSAERRRAWMIVLAVLLGIFAVDAFIYYRLVTTGSAEDMDHAIQQLEDSANDP
jgi:hypothetical protein